MFKVLAVSALLVVAQAIEYGHAQGGYNNAQGGYNNAQAGYGAHHEDYYTEPHYSFAYEVKDSHTGDYKSHKEERKGDHTQGVYSLVEPDGSTRTVEYVVTGKSGFNAKVHREAGKHPQSNKGYQSGGNDGYKSAGGYQQSSGGYHDGAVSHATYQNHGGYSGHQESGYKAPQISYHSQPAYHAQPVYHAQPAYHAQEQSYHSQPSHGSGHATSSISINTHGAKLSSSTYHAPPPKKNYY